MGIHLNEQAFRQAAEDMMKLILQRIEFMMQYNEPNTRMYYDDLSVILKDLDSTDFKSERWGSLSGII